MLDLDAASGGRARACAGPLALRGGPPGAPRGLHLHRVLGAGRRPSGGGAAAGAWTDGRSRGRRRRSGRTAARPGRRAGQRRSRAADRGGALAFVAARTLLLVVRGPIAREYQPITGGGASTPPSLEEGYRVHLHRRCRLSRRGDRRRELRVRLRRHRLGPPRARRLGGRGRGGRPARRRLPPTAARPRPRRARAPGALSPPSAPSAAPSGAATPPARASACVLDNVAQFRFYSAWRAALERRRAAEAGHPRGQPGPRDAHPARAPC